MKPESSIEEKIKHILRSSRHLNALKDAPADCPKDEELADYISGEMLSDKKEKISAHINKCQRCLDIAAISLKALNEDDEPDSSKVPGSVIKKAASIPKKYPRKSLNQKGIFKKNKYLIVAGVFFILSFIVKKYFMQLLLATAVFSIKWIMDTGSTKALIMIYDAWKTRKDDDSDDSNLLSGHRKNRDTSRL